MKNEIWKILRKSWEVWIVVVSVLIGVGILKIDLISVQIPKEWTVPFVMGVILLGALIALGISLSKVRNLENALQDSIRKLQCSS